MLAAEVAEPVSAPAVTASVPEPAVVAHPAVAESESV